MPAFTPPQPFTPPAGVALDPAQTVLTIPLATPGIATTPPAVTTPAVTASPMTVANTTGLDVNVYISASTSVTSVVINGVTVPGGIPTANATGDYYLPAGQSMTITYTGTLTMAWLAA